MVVITAERLCSGFFTSFWLWMVLLLLSAVQDCGCFFGFTRSSSKSALTSSSYSKWHNVLDSLSFISYCMIDRWNGNLEVVAVVVVRIVVLLFFLLLLFRARFVLPHGHDISTQSIYTMTVYPLISGMQVKQPAQASPLVDD